MIIKRKIAKLKRNIKKAPLSSYVAFSLSMIIIFTIIMLIFFAIYQQVPDSLIAAFFACFGGETLACALIKTMKLKEENQDE